MSVTRSCLSVAMSLALAGSPVSAAFARSAAPQQRWVSADGMVHLLRPVASRVVHGDAPLGSLMSQGWRLVWDGSAQQPGQLVVRLVLKVRPNGPGPGGTASEVLQIGRSADPHVVRQCLTYGLRGGSGGHVADRVINGRRYAVWTNGDAGMSQSITATDLRTVVHGVCYAVERFRYGESASDGDPSVTLSDKDGAARIDAALASVRLGK